MFNSRYYKNRFVYELENGYKAMIELNGARREYYYFLPNDDEKIGYDILIRKFDKKPINYEKIQPLGVRLEEYGFTDKDFSNPFGRTRKIVQVLDAINELEMKIQKTKIKK